MLRSRLALPLPALLVALPLAPAAAQNPPGSVLPRTPNMVTNWVGEPWTVQFNFIHRFTESGPPQHQISNAPTFFVAAGLPARSNLGFAYSTSSQVVFGRPNEWEFFVRNMPFRPGNKVADVTLHLGHNVGAASTDGELGIARSFGAVRLLAAGRAFSNAFGEGDHRTAGGAGVNIKLLRWLAASGDISSMMDRRVGERIGWSGGLMFGIPTTPHSFSIHATNTVTGTLEGISLGTRQTRWGFEYTVPITLARYIPALRPKSRATDVIVQSDSTPTPTTVATVVADSVRQPTVAPTEPVATPVPTPAPTNPPAGLPVRKDAPAVPTPTPTAPPTAAPTTSAPTTSAPPTAAAPRPSRPASPASGRRDTVRVGMKQLEFAPARIEVAAGTTVIWTNGAPLPHSIVADNGSFDSGLIDAGKRYARTFTTPGTYAFHCLPHPFMKGVVVVR